MYDSLCCPIATHYFLRSISHKNKGQKNVLSFLKRLKMTPRLMRSLSVGMKRRPKRLLAIYYLTCVGILTWAYSESSALQRRRASNPSNNRIGYSSKDLKNCSATEDDINLLSVNLWQVSSLPFSLPLFTFFFHFAGRTIISVSAQQNPLNCTQFFPLFLQVTYVLLFLHTLDKSELCALHNYQVVLCICSLYFYWLDTK